MAQRAPVEDVGAGKLQPLNVRDRRREEKIVARHRPVVPLLLSPERVREIAGVHGMTRPADRLQVENAVRATEQHRAGKFGLLVHYRRSGHVPKITAPLRFPSSRAGGVDRVRAGVYFTKWLNTPDGYSNCLRPDQQHL